MSSVLDTSIYLNGTRLPNFVTCERNYEPNQTINMTLGGTLYVDFLNIRRAWTISWNKIFRTDYDILYSFFLWQYQNNSFPVLQVPAYGINTPVLLILDKHSIKHNGVVIEGLKLDVIEQYAFS